MYPIATIALSSIVVLSLPSRVTAGSPQYNVCVLLCVSTCGVAKWWGQPFLECFNNCRTNYCGEHLACLSSEATLMSQANEKNTTKNIKAIKTGDFVLTLKNGTQYWTEVLSNTKTEGSFEFIQIHAQNLQNTTQVKQLEVTPEHGLIFYRVDSMMTIDSASHLQIGDILVNSDGNKLSVIDIKKTTHDEKYTLETSEGTVLASNFFVTTLCKEEVTIGEQPFDLVIEDWKSRHPDFLKMQQIQSSEKLVGEILTQEDHTLKEILPLGQVNITLD